MANPYSTPSEFTPKRIPLEMFADLAAKKETEFQQSQLAAAELMGNFNVQEGLLTKGLAARKNKEYTDKVLALQEQLMSTKDAASAARELVKLNAQYKTDAEVQAGAKDAEMTPKVLEYEINNPGGHFGYRDKQGNPIALNKLSSADVMNAYSNVAGPATFKEEDQLAQSMAPEEWSTLSEFKPFTTETGEIFYTNGKNQYSVREFTDKMFPTLKNVVADNYVNSNTAASNNYRKSGKGYDAYVRDTLERMRLFEIHKEDKNIQYQASAANSRMFGSNNGEDGQTGVKYNVVEGTGGYTAEAMFNPDNPKEIVDKRNELLQKYEQAGSYEEQQKIATELALVDGPATMYELEMQEFQNTKPYKEILDAFKTKHNITDEQLEYIKNNDATGFWQHAVNNSKDENERNYREFTSTAWTNKAYKLNKEYYKAIQQDFNKFTQTDNVSEIKTYTVSNAQPNWNEQYQTNFNIALNDGAFDLNASEFVTTGVDKTQKVELNQEEKARLLTVMNPAKIAYRNVEVAPDGVYLSIKVNNKALADGDSLDEAGWDTDESVSSNYTRVRLKLNKDKLREQFLKQDGGAFELLKGYQEYTTIGESEEGGRIHKSDRPDFLNGIAAQIFSVPVMSEKVNIAQEVQKDRPVLERLHGERDASIVDSPFISTKGVYYEDFTSDTTLNKKGVQLYYGQDAASKKAVTNSDITSMIADQEFKFTLKEEDIANMSINDLALEPSKNQFLLSFLNSVMLSNVAVNGSKAKAKKEEMVGNILDHIATNGANGQEIMDMISSYGVDMNELMNSAYVFRDREQATAYMFRGGKKSTPQSSANPLGVK